MSTKIERVSHVAESVIDNYRKNVFERVRVIYGMELRAFQWEWWFLMEQYPDVLGNACMRVGKTVVIQLKNLDEKLLNPYDEEMVFAPKHDQAVKTFKTQYDIIDKQPVVNAMLARNAAGKVQLGRGFAEFINGSTVKCFGVNSNFEGENATIQHVDELDDVPGDTLKRVKGRATGKNRNGTWTRHRFTGVIWGKLNIWQYENDAINKKPGAYFVLPKVNVYEGLAAGWLEEKDVMDQRRDMTDDEWLRTQCLQYVESRNFIWSSKLHFAQIIGLKWNLSPVVPVPGESLRRAINERVSFGLDMGKQGSGEDASDYSLQVTLSNGYYRRWLFGKTWPATVDPEIIVSDMVDLWKFFTPNGGYGDSLDANLIAQINDRLYESGLVRFDWRRLGGNEMEGWAKWAAKGLLTPINNGGRVKHHFYNSLQKAIHNSTNILRNEDPSARIFTFPMVDRDKAKYLEHWKELQILIRELENLQSERTLGGYLKISRISKREEDPELKYDGSSKLGDDRADALAMSNYYLDFMERKRHSGGFKMAYIRGI